MLVDNRIEKLAKLLVNHSCKVKENENVMIEASDIDYQLVNAIIKEVYKNKGRVFLNLSNNRIKAEMLKGATKEQIDLMTELDKEKMSKMQCYIGIRGGNNCFELSSVPEDKLSMFSKKYLKEVHHDIRVEKTKWVILRYPNPGMAQLSSMSTEDFEDFYFNVCTLDYKKMEDAMQPLVDLMNKTDKVRIVSKNGTDLSFSIKDIPAIKCSGECNIPDGEVYTAPVKNSVNGVIQYNTPTVYNGQKFENIRLEFKDGKIIKATANSNNEALNKILDTDEGARFVGEFAIGVNPYVLHPMCDILFDEKISGSIHFTPGCCYEDAPNGNKSAVHWDLVLIQREDYDAGEIYFDDKLIRKNGLFTLEELKCLNPENLK